MSIYLQDRLTAQFYDWEKLGRGWFICDVPIDLEPPFTPFYSHLLPYASYKDDGKHETILSSLKSLFTSSSRHKESGESQKLEPIHVEPYIFNSTEALHFITVSFPKDTSIGYEQSQKLLLMLSYCNSPISFEIIADDKKITLQFTTRESDTEHLASQIKAYFPEFIVRQSEDHLEEYITEGNLGVLTDYGLKSEFMRPLTTEEKFHPDPLIGLFGVLDSLKEKEHACIQILFTGAMNPWSESIMRSVTDNRGESFFEDAPEMVQLAKEKISSPLFAVSLRTFGGGSSIEEAERVFNKVSSALVRIYKSPYNSLIPLPSPEYGFDTRIDDLLDRTSHRVGMLINSDELLTLLHFPSDSVHSPKLWKSDRKTKAAPKITQGHKFILGENEHTGEITKVSLNSTGRLKHTHVIGATGTGKSTFLLNLVIQDIEHGNGIGVLDPHGDLIENIISHIPPTRIDDVVIIDPADSDYSVGFNILSAHSEIEKGILSSDLVAVFRRLSTSWGDQMNSVLANAILAFLESNEGGTLADLRRFLVEKTFRDSYLRTVTDDNIVYYWQKEFPLLRTGSIGPILTRLDTFLRPKIIRNMVAQKKGLNFEHLMDSKKIVLIKLSQGLIGAENSYLLGTTIVSKFHQAAMARQAMAKEERTDFFLYIDEFQHFITPSMSSILSGARKYHLGLILAHQDMQQLMKYDNELASSVISNAGTRICFRVGDIDAKRFEDGFSFFDAKDLQNLNTGEAIGRIEKPEFDFSLTISPPSESTQPKELVRLIIESSRQKYATPREFIESKLKQSRGESLNIKSEEPIPEKWDIADEEEEVIIPPYQEVKRKIPIEKDESNKKTKQEEERQHRYLQTLIMRMAQSRGYVVAQEVPTPDGKGRVDVTIERNGKKIAVEITVTTSDVWEIHNIEKCLAAGYDQVVSCSTDTKTLENIKRKIDSSLDESSKMKVMVLEPEAFFRYLDEQVAKEASTETRLKGYRVMVNYDPVDEDEIKAKRESIAKVVLDRMKKKKK